MGTFTFDCLYKQRISNVVPTDLLNYVSFLPTTARIDSTKISKCPNLMKLSSTSPTVITKDDEDFTSKEKIVLLENGYVEPLTLDDSKSELIGMWEGSFTMKNAKNGSQQVNESFFIHG